MLTVFHFIIIVLFLLIFTASASDVNNSYYTTNIVIRTKSQTDKPDLKICPVYNNKDIAFSMRWDDNNKANFTMQNLMHKYGIKGTFYMNARNYDFKKACQKGTDIGSHSMTHPFLRDLSNNRIFWEVAEIKPFLESRSNKPVNSYCFSFGNYSDNVDRSIGDDIAAMLQRVGYHHNAYLGFIKKYTKDKDPVSGYMQIVPGDREPSMAKFEKELNKLLNNQYWKKDNPNISIGVHVWMKTPKAWADMEEILKKYSKRPDWWYCTQTDYATYRKMFKLAKISDINKSPKQIEYTITLPYASDIGSNQALTLSYSGTATEILVNGKSVKFKNESGKTFFDISPPTFAKAPELISYVTNLKNTPKPNIKKKTALAPWLHISDNGSLVLTMKNSSANKLTKLRIKYIMPLMYNSPKLESISEMASGENKIITKKFALGTRNSDRFGLPFLLCQVDYLNNGKPERAYASTYGKAMTPPATNKFRDKSIISATFGDLDGLKDKLLKMSKPGSPWVADLEWFKSVDQERWFYRDSIAGPASRINMKGKRFNRKKPYIAMDYSFYSDIDGTFYMQNFSSYLMGPVQLFFVNGKNIPKKQIRAFKIKKGENRIVFVYKSAWCVPPYFSLAYIIK